MNRKRFIKIAFIVLCILIYMGRVYYVNQNVKGLRDYREIHIGEWVNAYGGKMKVNKIQTYIENESNMLRVDMDIEDVPTDFFTAHLIYDDYVNAEWRVSDNRNFNGVVIDMGKHKLKKGDFIVFKQDKGNEYEKYILKVEE